LPLERPGRAPAAPGEDTPPAFPREGHGHRAADPPPRSRDEGDLTGEPHRMRPPRDLISSMNSARVSGQSRNWPSMAEVTALEFCFSTPRMSMHMWSASMTTATPL